MVSTNYGFREIGFICSSLDEEENPRGLPMAYARTIKSVFFRNKISCAAIAFASAASVTIEFP